MPTINFPMLSRGPSSLVWSLQSNTLVHQSPLSGSTRTISTPGTRWKVTATWNSLRPRWHIYDGDMPPEFNNDGTPDVRRVESFLAALNGRAGRFYMQPPLANDRRFLWPNSEVQNATVNGAGQTGTNLNIVAIANRLFSPGQFFEVNGELKQLTQWAATDNNGYGQFVFGPPLRSSPPNGANINLTTPKATFMLMDDNAGLTYGAGGYADFTLDAIETFL